MKSRNWNPYYSGAEWRSLSRHVKRRDCYQCQICGDRRGDPHCILHAHHITPRASGGQNALENLITLCDLCHAVVTPRWLRPWFGELTPEQIWRMEEARQEFLEFLALAPQARRHRQALVWHHLGRNR